MEFDPLIARSRSRKADVMGRITGPVLGLQSRTNTQGESVSIETVPTNSTITHTESGVEDDSDSRGYDEMLYDIIAFVLKYTYRAFILIYQSGHHAYVRHIQTTEDVQEHPEPREADTEEVSAARSDTEESVVILNVTEKKRDNIFEPLLRFDEEAEYDQNESTQYGTSLSIAKKPRYTANTYTPKPVAQYSRIATNANDTSNVELFESTRINDYDSYVSKFYLPQAPVAKNKYSIVDTLIDNFFVDGITDLFRERKQRQELISKEREQLKTKLHPLTKDQLYKVNKSWNKLTSAVVTSAFQIEITTRDLQTLCDGEWLNDNILDFYFSLITVNNSSAFGWTTHFFTTLKLKGYQSVARWSKRKKVNVTTKDLILVPINIMGTHWALAAVNNKEKCFQYFDSLSSNGNLKALQILKDYMIQEGKKHNSTINFDSYSMMKNMPTPQQQNGFDCGVFTCMCANYLSKNKELTYSQKDMKLLRRRMAYEILSKDLLD